jgi:CheY-like chemotaxis protein
MRLCRLFGEHRLVPAATARHFRALYPDRLTLIAITAQDSEDDRRRAYRAGFDLHLSKPAGPQAVLRLLLAASGLLGRNQ